MSAFGQSHKPRHIFASFLLICQVARPLLLFPLTICIAMLALMTASPKPAPRRPNPAAELAGSIAARLDRPVVLVGLMGSGKSAVGRRAAKQLGIGFKDSDQLIVKAAGISIVEIFELAGEVKFREMERKTLSNLVLASPQIIATGGGAFCQDATADLLLQHTLTIWLKASPATLLSRIGNTKTRPLLHNSDPLATLTRLDEQRAPYYKKAHIHLDTDGLSTYKAMMTLLHALDTHLPRQ
ncbi:shikimate kinase [Alphaproteobacteria bacterium]|jgi:shikimate kinase|nr:shikimate kinase [Alphaproteobacteria bacterium]